MAVLVDHKLAFTRMSTGRECGVADAVPNDGSLLWGVVYEIPDREVGQLDKSEGYRPGRTKNSYWRRECMVFQEGDEARPLAVFTYLAERQPAPPNPSAAYKELIVSGARWWHLPDSYVRELEQIKADP
jgi:gamma-glutamylcyclotransferase (GGCT)/AIG2-like uncharacterized protein YtfP